MTLSSSLRSSGRSGCRGDCHIVGTAVGCEEGRCRLRGRERVGDYHVVVMEEGCQCGRLQRG